MKQYFTYHGKTVEKEIVSKLEIIEMEKAGYKLATPDERTQYVLQKDKEEKEIREKVEANPDIIDVQYVNANSHDGYGYTGRFFQNKLLDKDIYLNPKYTGQKIGLCYLVPNMLPKLQTQYKILYTMWESSKFPDTWRKYFDMADEVWVPSKTIQELVKAQFDIEAKLVPLGYDADVFKPIERVRTGDEPYTFLHYDAFKSRKGWDTLFNAFTAEFGKNENVKLIYKTTLPREPLPFHMYPQIEVIKGIFDTQEMYELMARSDCFVFPAVFEGFGLPPLEAMATGMRTISSSAGGLRDHVESVFRTYHAQPAEYDNFNFKPGEAGLQYRPDVNELRTLMRLAYETRPKNKIDVSKKTIQNTVEMIEKEIKEIDKKTVHIESRNRRVIFMTEDGDIYSGGRYYTWFMAYAMVEAGFNVHVYTNRYPSFFHEFRKYKKPVIHIVDDLQQVDEKGIFYIGAPVKGIKRAVELASKYSRQAYALIFDPHPTLKKYKELERVDEWEEVIPLMKQGNVDIVALADCLHDDIREWLGEKNIMTIYPCINNRELPTKTFEKKDWITFVSRLDPYKNIDHVLDAVKDTGYKLQIITSVDGVGIHKMIEEKGMTGQVVIHWEVTDKEKFEIIAQSKAVINASTYEGFGVWIIEALSLGVPVVCYDYFVFREIEKYDQEGLMCFAEYKNKEDLKKQLLRAVKKNGRGIDSFFDMKIPFYKFPDIYEL